MTNNEKICGVTGANGYLGSVVCRHFESRGWKVFRLQRVKDGSAPAGVIPYSLDGGVEPSVLAQNKIRVVIHCAYDFTALKEEDVRTKNKDGSLKLFEAAAEAGARVVFVSSMSAFEGCKSIYGRVKLETEKAPTNAEVFVIRPGLVYGENPGGMVGALNKVAARSPVVPLIGTGNQMLHPVHEDDLGRSFETLATASAKSVTGPVVAASEKAVSFKNILRILAGRKNRRPIFIPVPALLVLYGLRFLELLGIRARLRSDSLVSLMNQDTRPDFTAARNLQLEFREFN